VQSFNKLIFNSASEMTSIVSSGALNSTHSLAYFPYNCATGILLTSAFTTQYNRPTDF